MDSPLVTFPSYDTPIAVSQRHRLWTPPPAQAPLVEWWRPAVAYARRCRLDEVPWAVFVEDLDYLGTVLRGRLPSIWLYRHHRGAGELCVGSAGEGYRFRWAQGGRSPGRFQEVDVRTALWAARLPDVLDTAIEPLRRRREEPSWADEPVWEPAEEFAPVRHLRSL